ncbi:MULTISPECIES: Gfo/Idh/MocA family protein [Maribacter]|uniref:Gfo/Idh/MocA family oxidoreductase n=1 Tax=Maribacter flavus TaxID=1658664 RepID=A0ABU7IL39_9FLAO|nr:MULTISPECIES: Gfo/Idh/MocA family oxidoreductase [Maribacter]MDC6406564.1 Gfo/Idh/MocA family oxidoreductase [Maribacter sp. PR66]MEE1973682.1 Gfo/Idh/MocA family oxidoreductase [Maribacter flavus]
MKNSRREFVFSISMLAASSAFPIQAFAFDKSKKLKVALVGTGIRGITFWGKRLMDEYSEILEFVGLSDINPSRLEYGKTYIGASCPTFTSFEDMVSITKPDLVIVTTKDSTHHEFIIKGLGMGCDVLTEKPLTIDEFKCQQILDAEKASNKNLIVGFNYRWSPYATKIKELISNKTIGDLVSVDFNWYLNTYHGASYFRRWHGEMDSSGSLWVHKATHHFDLLNWWINSEPNEVFAYGDLEFYGKNGPFRGKNCRTCDHKNECAFYWDIHKDEFSKKLYVDHEHADGYIRDNCLFREDIDIYDKMSAQVRYTDNTILNYSLTTYSPFEGWRVAFNGTEGRIEAWLDIPYFENTSIDEAEKHANEMAQDGGEIVSKKPIVVHKLWQEFETVQVDMEESGHGGGDKRLQDKIFVNPEVPDPFGRTAGSRDGAMSILIGIAARKSIQSGKPIKISELTDLEPQVRRT